MTLKNIFVVILISFALLIVTSCKEDKNVNQNVSFTEQKTIADTTAAMPIQKHTSKLINDSLKNVLSTLSLKQLKKEYLPILKSIDEVILMLQRMQIIIQQQSKGIDDIETTRKIMLTEGNAVKIKKKAEDILNDYNAIKSNESKEAFSEAINAIFAACSNQNNNTWEEQCFGNLTTKAAIAQLESWVNECKKAQNEVISQTIK
jgi:hypothetical protein